MRYKKQTGGKRRRQKGGKRHPALFQTLPDETPKQMKERLEQEKIDKMYPDGTPYDDDGPYGEEPKNKKSKTMKNKQTGGDLGASTRRRRAPKGMRKKTTTHRTVTKEKNPGDDTRKTGLLTETKGQIRRRMKGKKVPSIDFIQPSKEVKFDGPSKKEAGGTTHYPVYAKDSEQAKSFRKAYAAAKPGSVFTWEGRKYKKEGPKPVAGKPAKTVDTSGSSTMDKIAKGDTSDATKVKASATPRSKKRDIRKAGRAERKADRKSGAAKVARMEKRNVKKVGRIQDRQTSKARREEARTERQAPRKAKKAAIKRVRSQARENIRAAKGKPSKKFLGGLMGAIGGLKGTKGQGFGARLRGMARGAAGGSMLGRAFGAAKGLAGAVGQGGGLKGAIQGAAQGAAGGAFGNSNPMAQAEAQGVQGAQGVQAGGQEEMQQQAKRGGMRDRRKARQLGRDIRKAERKARRKNRRFNRGHKKHSY